MPGIVDDTIGPPSILGYEVRHEADGYHARYCQVIDEHARAFGCLQQLHDVDPRALLRRAVANRVRVWVYQSRPADDGVTRDRRANPQATADVAP